MELQNLGSDVTMVPDMAALCVGNQNTSSDT